jgi:hypothetical protein
MSDKRITKISRTERYTVDGKEYDSLDDMPEEARRKLEAHLKLLEDKDGDGVPDILQGQRKDTSGIQSRQVHISAPRGRMKDAERAGELITDLLKDLGAGSYGVDTRAAEQQRDGSESPQLRRQRREHRRERVRSYIVILILLGVIAYFFLEKL